MSSLFSWVSFGEAGKGASHSSQFTCASASGTLLSGLVQFTPVWSYCFTSTFWQELRKLLVNARLIPENFFLSSEKVLGLKSVTSPPKHQLNLAILVASFFIRHCKTNERCPRIEFFSQMPPSQKIFNLPTNQRHARKEIQDPFLYCFFLLSYVFFIIC